MCAMIVATVTTVVRATVAIGTVVAEAVTVRDAVDATVAEAVTVRAISIDLIQAKVNLLLNR